MAVKEKVFWHDTTYMPTGESLCALVLKVDLVVVGAGIPGLAADAR